MGRATQKYGQTWILSVVTAANFALLSADSGPLSASFNLATKPEFVLEHSSNATSHVNSTVILNCRVRYMSSRQVVSWGRGIEVLTVGLMVFAGSGRFKPLHHEDSQDWGLRIMAVRQSDAGWYFCQVNTTPPVSHHLYLNVVDPKVEIIGAPELYVEKGSLINLTCVILDAHNVPDNVRWTHNHKLVQYDLTREGIRIRTYYERRRTISYFIIEHALPSDSGEYFCDPDGLTQARVTVHVLSGDQTAAMQRGGGGGSLSSTGGLLTALLTAVAWLGQAGWR